MRKKSVDDKEKIALSHSAARVKEKELCQSQARNNYQKKHRNKLKSKQKEITPAVDEVYGKPQKQKDQKPYPGLVKRK